MFNNVSQQFFKTQGIGLGLTTARRLTESMLGAIHLTSKVEKGTAVGFSVMTMEKQMRIHSLELMNTLKRYRKVHFSFQGITNPVSDKSVVDL